MCYVKGSKVLNNLKYRGRYNTRELFNGSGSIYYPIIPVLRPTSVITVSNVTTTSGVLSPVLLGGHTPHTPLLDRKCRATFLVRHVYLDWHTHQERDGGRRKSLNLLDGFMDILHKLNFPLCGQYGRTSPYTRSSQTSTYLSTSFWDL